MHKAGNHNIPDGAKIGLSFNHGAIDHPRYGSASASGVIPFLLPQGEIRLPAILFDKSGMDAIVQKCLPEYRHLWPDDLDEDICAKILDLAILIACVTPDCDFEDPAVMLALEFYIVLFAADDFIDKCMASGTLDFAQTLTLFAVVQDLLGGKYKTEEEIPLISPEVEIFVKLLWNWVRKLENNRKDWNEATWTSFQRCVEEDITAHALLNDPQRQFSESTRNYLRAYASGWNASLQFIGWVRNQVLPETVDKNLLYQRMRFCSSICSDLLNDVMGLSRDIRKDQKDTTIIAAVVEKGVDLQTAFDTTYGRLLDSINDISVAMGKLEDLYKGNQDVLNFLRMMRLVIDGQTLWYAKVGRYGDTNPRVVQM